jgi:hypothetical protein
MAPREIAPNLPRQADDRGKISDEAVAGAYSKPETKSSITPEAMKTALTIGNGESPWEVAVRLAKLANVQMTNKDMVHLAVVLRDANLPKGGVFHSGVVLHLPENLAGDARLASLAKALQKSGTPTENASTHDSGTPKTAEGKLTCAKAHQWTVVSEGERCEAEKYANLIVRKGGEVLILNYGSVATIAESGKVTAALPGSVVNIAGKAEVHTYGGRVFYHGIDITDETPDQKKAHPQVVVVKESIADLYKNLGMSGPVPQELIAAAQQYDALYKEKHRNPTMYIANETPNPSKPKESVQVTGLQLDARPPARERTEPLLVTDIQMDRMRLGQPIEGLPEIILTESA